ncbi:charged multivesicular body protein 2a [Eurosta solidaginis]|uniref:charged multivesicular body protein 2a n=1 Tax=Eurosta solidaginis TaxID=178769 RepID=UPI0035308DFB
MDWLFGKKISPDEMMRKNQRALNRAMRDLDRERMKMEQQEKKIIADIKRMAKEGQMDAVKIMAKDLVRTRRYVKKFMLMKANIQAVSLKIQTLKSQNTMAQAMRGVTKAMQNMNRQLNLPQIQKILHEFEKQSEIMDMKEEMINDAIDDAMEDEGDEEETDAVVAQVFDELGLQVGEQLGDLPTASGSLSIAGGAKSTPSAVAAGGVGGGVGASGSGNGSNGGAGGVAAGGSGASSPVSDADADLQARLDKLRRD